MPATHAKVLFVCSDQTPLGHQCLRILRQLGCQTGELDHGVPAPPGSWLLFACFDTKAKFPSGFLRTAGFQRSGITPPGYGKAAERVIAIRGARLRKNRNEFVGEDLVGLTRALENLCGYVSEDAVKNKKRRRERQNERRAERRRERFQETLSA